MHLFIVNPKAGKWQGEKVWQTVQKKLEELQVPYRVELTTHARHATEIAKNSLTQPDISAVVAVGGDGTVHEVVNGIVGSQMPFGYIPAGTGNDFAISSDIPRNAPLLALERILRNQPRPIDTIQVGDEVAICNLGIGLDGKVASLVSQSNWKQWMGKLAYPYGLLRGLGSYRPSNITFRLDGETYEYKNAWLVAVCNVATYGGGMRICPEAVQTDGLLDICCVTNISALELLRVFPLVYSGKHVHHPAVTLLRGKELEIESDEKLIIHADGEIVGETPITIKVRTGSLLVFS